MSWLWIVVAGVLFFPALFGTYVFVKAVTYAYFRAKHKEDLDWEQEQMEKAHRERIKEQMERN